MSRKDIRTNKLLEKQIITCAKENGYKGKSKEVITIKENNIEIGWLINKFILYNDQLLQYQRDSKLKKLLKLHEKTKNKR